MYCTKCGAQLDPSARFCTVCGTAVSSVPVQPAAPVVQTPPPPAAAAFPVQPAVQPAAYAPAAYAPARTAPTGSEKGKSLRLAACILAAVFALNALITGVYSLLGLLQSPTYYHNGLSIVTTVLTFLLVVAAPLCFILSKSHPGISAIPEVLLFVSSLATAVTYQTMYSLLMVLLECAFIVLYFLSVIGVIRSRPAALISVGVLDGLILVFIIISNVQTLSFMLRNSSSLPALTLLLDLIGIISLYTGYYLLLFAYTAKASAAKPAAVPDLFNPVQAAPGAQPAASYPFVQQNPAPAAPQQYAPQQYAPQQYAPQNVQPYAPGMAPDAPSAGYAALGFFVPLAGLIIYLTCKDTTPLRARSAGKGALAGVITSAGLTLLYILIIFAITASQF